MARNRGFDVDQTIDKAIHVFRDKGYEGTSMQDLVDELGLSRSSIYETFGSKKDLYTTSLSKYSEQSEDRIKEFLYEDEPAKELIARFLTQIIRDNRDETCMMVKASLEMCDHDDVEGKVQRNCDTNENGYRQLLIRAAAKGELVGNPDIDALSRYLVNVQNGLAISAISYDEETLVEIINTSLYFFK